MAASKVSEEAGAAVADVQTAPAPATTKIDSAKKQSAAAPALQILVIPLSDLKESPTNPRTHFNDEKIKEIGDTLKLCQIHPILVRNNPGKGPEKYELVCGANRLRAAKVAGLPNLQATVRDLTDVEVMELQLIENAKRGDISAMEEATAFDRYMKKGKLTAQQLADKTSYSIRHIYQRLKLLDSATFVREALEEGKITPAHADLINRLPKERQRDAFDSCFVDEWSPQGSIEALISVRDFENWIKREIYRDLSVVPWKLDDASLLPKSGACIGCKFNTGCNPNLFSDLKKDHCQNGDCYDEKFELHIAARQKTEALVKITEDHYSNRDSETVGKEHYKESKAANAVKAIFVDGPRMGQETKVEIKKEAPKAAREAAREVDPETGKKLPEPEKKVAPLAERQKTKWKQRNAWICDELKRIMPQVEPDEIKAVHKDKWALVVFSLAAAFGTTIRNDSSGYQAGKCWGDFDKLIGSKNAETIAKSLWPEVQGIFVGRLNYYTQDRLPIEDAKRCAELIGKPWKDLETRAVEVLPDPKSWAAEVAEKEPKKDGKPAYQSIYGCPVNSDAWVEEQLRSALCSTDGAKKRWSARTELSDAKLKEAIAEEFDLGRGFVSQSPLNGPHVDYRGGKRPYLSVKKLTSSKPDWTLNNDALLNAVRKLLKIKTPNVVSGKAIMAAVKAAKGKKTPKASKKKVKK